MNIFLRIVTFPVTMFYGVAVFLRNVLFERGLLPIHEFSIPTICIGNLNMGGTGKSPHTEYVAELTLKYLNKIAILSRGYKRKTKGYLEVNQNNTYLEVGDEPAMFRKKFPESKVIVAVDENRRRGINTLLQHYPDLQLIILDDAFQHRYVKAGLNILLSDYYYPFWKDAIFPFGNLRESKSGLKRADVLVITKSPPVVSPIIKRDIYIKAGLQKSQELLFSKIVYQSWVPVFNQYFVPEKSYSTIFLLTGIANPYPLQLYLKQFCLDIVLCKFRDHHDFNIDELKKIKVMYDNYLTSNKAIITSEKDAMRMKDSQKASVFENIPFFYVPIKVAILDKDRYIFNQLIIDYVTKN